MECGGCMSKSAEGTKIFQDSQAEAHRTVQRSTASIALMIPAILLLFLQRESSLKRQSSPSFPIRPNGQHHGDPVAQNQKDNISFPYVKLPIMRPHNKPSTNLTVYKGVLSRTVYVLNTTQDISVVAPYRKNIDHNNNNHTDHHRHHPSFWLERVASQSKRNACLWATNGGPFHQDGSSAGSLIIDKQLIVDDFGGAVGFGAVTTTTATGPHHPSLWVLGAISKANAKHLHLDFYVTGFDWLVYRGENVVPNCTKEPLIPRAPRTAVGVDHVGNLILVVADGCERCLRKRGPTLLEMADFLIQTLGLRYAINMDGGSSSTMVRQSRVVNKPTCLDVDLVTCARPVASVICIR